LIEKVITGLADYAQYHSTLQTSAPHSLLQTVNFFLTSCHKGSSSNIWRQIESLANDIKSRYKVVIADDSKREDEISANNSMNQETTLVLKYSYF